MVNKILKKLGYHIWKWIILFCEYTWMFRIRKVKNEDFGCIVREERVRLVHPIWLLILIIFLIIYWFSYLKEIKQDFCII